MKLSVKDIEQVYQFAHKEFTTEDQPGYPRELHHIIAILKGYDRLLGSKGVQSAIEFETPVEYLAHDEF